MSQWNGSSESGILRKNNYAENHEELLVFGYACKLFRDDEKALYIDQGKHLIPWMGDDTLKIDRYDGRGTLSDLTKFEASREGFDAMRWLGLSEKERNIEELCDKERYYSLIINEEEEQMYKEEELKRQKTNEIQYSYDVPQNPDLKQENSEGIPTVPEADEEYVPPPILDVPIDILKPKTVKENARIEKTALFVCKQGPQMEILLKAKQGDNPQFSFLNQDDKLYKFYRHVLAAFKNGRYQGYEAHVKQNENQSDHTEQESSSHYLHPSLSASSSEPAASTAITIPQIPYKPSVNCAYSQLVNRIQGTQAETQEPTPPPKAPDYAQMTYDQQQYYQYYYIQQYFEYYKQLAMFQQGQAGNPGQFVPPTDFQNLDPALQHYIQQVAYSQYLQYHQQNTNSYAQIVSNLNKDSNPYAPQVPKSQEQERTVTVTSEKSEVTVNVKKPLLSLAEYGSGSDSEEDESEAKSDERTVTYVKPNYSVPTGEIQIVIDKMAVHVSKNGEQFEAILKTKNDPRFEFLNEKHEFHQYYKEKLKKLRGDVADGDKSNKNDDKVFKKEKKIIAPVSFSIKKPKEEQTKEIKSALPIEESDEEEHASTATPITNVPHSIANSTSVLKLSSDSNQIKTEQPENNNNKKNDEDKDEDPILEMIELTQETDDRKDAKRAEDKIKDKLAAAAREKLALASKDRALQMERKKKAAAFLKLKSAQNNHSDTVPDKSVSPLRRDSIEIIEIDSGDSSPKKRKHKRDKDRRRGRSRSKSRSRERRKEHRKGKERRRSVSSDEEEEENRRKDYYERKDKRKKYKRKHSRSRHESKTRKKSKKRHKRSESESSDSAESVL